MRAKRSAHAMGVLLLALTAAAPAEAAGAQPVSATGPEVVAVAGPEMVAAGGPEARVPADQDGSVPAIGRSWPVGERPPILRGWEPPATRYSRGHRGVDLSAPPGTPVRAVAPGRVSYAGRVAGKGVVSVELTGTGDPPLRVTYQPVHASVRKGDEVAAGEVIGTTETSGSHCASPCLHWGLRRGEAYLDPLSLLPPWLLRNGPSRLLPVLGVPLPT
ncbi:murein hydrolase activator EnvC family protein [Streptomyces sp. NPDC089424]|uniref:murein hydrolase activator EnvC family protein n=1 Tax=Streptomyces sp. NPDC089424 TaxID=3365917 RepID=UPI00380C47C1